MLCGNMLQEWEYTKKNYDKITVEKLIKLLIKQEKATEA